MTVFIEGLRIFKYICGYPTRYLVGYLKEVYERPHAKEIDFYPRILA
jgi:hypothetical protein